MLFIWIAIFIVSLYMLVKGADWLLVAAKKIGFAIGLSPFVIGMTIVAFGTTAPELISSLVAVLSGVNDFVIGNVLGSNVANILLILGISSVVAKRLSIPKDLVAKDLPIFVASVVLFIVMIWDGKVTIIESLFLLVAFVIYLSLILISKEDSQNIEKEKPNITIKDAGLFILGVLGLLVGSKYLIQSVVSLSLIFNLAPGIIAVTVVALGTSFPELIVSIKAAMRHQSEMAIGNIFGANILNLLLGVGLPGLFSPLVVGSGILTVGIPFLIMVTALFSISAISKHLKAPEGAMYILIYAIFIAKMFDLF